MNQIQRQEMRTKPQPRSFPVVSRHLLGESCFALPHSLDQPNPDAFAHVAVAIFCPSSFELLAGRNMPRLLVGQEVETTREESSDEASPYSEVI